MEVSAAGRSEGPEGYRRWLQQRCCAGRPVCVCVTCLMSLHPACACSKTTTPTMLHFLSYEIYYKCAKAIIADYYDYYHYARSVVVAFPTGQPARESIINAKKKRNIAFVGVSLAVALRPERKERATFSAGAKSRALLWKTVGCCSRRRSLAVPSDINKTLARCFF